MKKVMRRKGVEDAIQRLDKLTQEQAHMAVIELLAVAHNVDNKATVVGHVQGIDAKVSAVDEKVSTILDKVQEIFGRVEGMPSHWKLTHDLNLYSV